MKTHYNDLKLAETTSPVHTRDVRRLLTAFQKVLENYDRLETAGEGDNNADFQGFYELLYGSGMVMKGFDGPLFDSSIGRLVVNPTVAPVMMKQANLLTLRMVLHTLARGYRATECGGGYPYFDEAYRSGGLKEIYNRLDLFCADAEDRSSKTLGEEI